MDTPPNFIFVGNHVQSSGKATEECRPPNTSFLVWGGFIPPQIITKRVLVPLKSLH
jgi:hypothetical protein